MASNAIIPESFSQDIEDFVDKVTISKEDFDTMTNSQWVSAYCSKKDITQPGTAKSWRTALNWLIRHCKGRIVDLSYRDMKVILCFLALNDELRLKPKLKYYTNLRGFYEWVIGIAKSLKMNWISPFVTKKDLPDFEEKRPKPKVPEESLILTKDQVFETFECALQCGYPQYIAVRLMAFCGLRPSELVSIRIKNINFEERFFITGMEKNCAKSNPTKSEETALVFIIPEVMVDELREYVQKLQADYPSNEWLFPSNLNQGAHFTVDWIQLSKKTCEGHFPFVLRAREKVGVPAFTLYWFRKTLDTRRKSDMKCPDNINHHLLNHQVKDIEAQAYDKFDAKQLRNWFDEYNPYK